MGPENFFSSGMFLVPLVMMLLFFLIMRFGFGKGPFFGNNQNSDGASSEESPIDILKKRYAKGDISKEEF
jgi:putative membrane protein